MSRDESIHILRNHEFQLRERFGVKSPALFGSVVRGKVTEASDIDLLVDSEKGITLFDLAAAQQYLETLLGVEKVDRALQDAVLPALNENIFGEAVRAFGETVDVPR